MSHLSFNVITATSGVQEQFFTNFLNFSFRRENYSGAPLVVIMTLKLGLLILYDMKNLSVLNLQEYDN